MNTFKRILGLKKTSFVYSVEFRGSSKTESDLITKRPRCRENQISSFEKLDLKNGDSQMLKEMSRDPTRPLEMLKSARCT